MAAFSKILRFISVGIWLLLAVLLAFSSNSFWNGLVAFAIMAGAALLSFLLMKLPIIGGYFIAHIVFFGLLFALAFAMQS